ncbi:hypothetical protein DWF04_018565 [Cereibacter sphaeroides f. sp. denitrificans]|nr:hypothetical protein DWF04_03570 [Cereibacter sphaeroides f. sp. denitrificans]
MTSFDPLRDLHPPRLPVAFASFGWAEALVAFGLGLLLALLLFELVRPAFIRRSGFDLEAELARLAGLPPAERMLGQLRLLRRFDAPLPAEARAHLYRAGEAPPDLAPAIRAAARRGRHA